MALVVEMCNLNLLTPSVCAPFRVVNKELIVATDLMQSITQKSREDAAKIIRDLKEDVFSSKNFIIQTLPGKGNANLRLVDFKNASNLAMIAPGNTAKKIRSLFSEILTRVAGGDMSLISTIVANSQSSSPIAQMARASLAGAGSSAGVPPPTIIYKGPSGAAVVPSAPAIGGSFQSIPRVPTNLDARAAEIDAKLDARAAALDGKAVELDTRAAALDGKAVELDARAAALDGKAVELDAELKKRQDEFSAMLDSQAVEVFKNIHEREAGLDARTTELNKQKAELDLRAAELDRRDTLITERQAAVLSALAVESDKNFKKLEERKAEIEANSARNDAVIREIGEKLDQRDAELKKRAAELDQRAAVVVAEEAPVGRKRQREVEFSLVTQVAEEWSKIDKLDLDAETKQELKQRLFAMLDRAD